MQTNFSWASTTYLTWHWALLLSSLIELSWYSINFTRTKNMLLSKDMCLRPGTADVHAFRISERSTFQMLCIQPIWKFWCIDGISFGAFFCVRNGSQRVLLLLPLWKRVIALGARPPPTPAAVYPALPLRWIFIQTEWVSISPEARTLKILFQEILY